MLFALCAQSKEAIPHYLEIAAIKVRIIKMYFQISIWPVVCKILCYKVIVNIALASLQRQHFCFYIIFCIENTATQK
jgi:hypothetical protein